MIYTVRPISDRTPFGGSQEPTPFRATWAQTLKLLEARANAHPDRNGGDRTGWDQVEQAAAVFGLIS